MPTGCIGSRDRDKGLFREVLRCLIGLGLRQYLESMGIWRCKGLSGCESPESMRHLRKLELLISMKYLEHIVAPVSKEYVLFL